jgi:hypothetical protein
METQPHYESLTEELERAVMEVIAILRERLGLQVHAQRDPGHRIVSYGYHWHHPDPLGVCENRTFYGYTTAMAALTAGLIEGFTVGMTIVALHNQRLADHLVLGCTDQSADHG